MRPRLPLLAGIALALASGCERPMLARDGTLVFQERGAHGAAIVTANGLEYHDRRDVPQRVVVRDANAPWHAPIGFIVPADGRFVTTSHATVVGTPGLAIALRPSDTRVPSWGGEVLVRIDVLAPAAPGSTREEERVALLLDGGGTYTMTLADVTLGQLGARDHVAVLDAEGAKVIVPSLPASHRSLADAAVAKRLESEHRGRADLAQALARAVSELGTTGTRRLVLLSDGALGELTYGAVGKAFLALAESGVHVTIVATTEQPESALAQLANTAGADLVADSSMEWRTAALRAAIPPAGLVAFNDVVLTFEGTPAPSHVLEASGGDVRWELDAGDLALGDVQAGQMRTEVVRVSVPAWQAGQEFKFTVTARFGDVSQQGKVRMMSAELPCVYDDDIERIAKSRHGDVIAYASALATLRRLDAAFIGQGVIRAGGLKALARMHARSLSLLARDMHDPQIAEQAELLSALMEATD